jgi:hypothetical protein
MQAYLTLQKRILRRLTAAGPSGLSRTDLFRSLGSPITKSSLDIALAALKRRSMALARRIETGTRGRPSEVWWASGLIPKESA